MITAGVDVSLTGTGVVVLENGKIKKQKLIKTKPRGDKPVDELERLIYILGEIIIDLEECQLVAIEGLAFMARNTTALVQLSGLNYLLRYMLNKDGVAFIIVAPTSLKKFVTLKGNSDKNVVMMEIFKRYGETLPDNNIADSYGLSRIAEAVLDSKVELAKPQQEVINLIKKQL